MNAYYAVKEVRELLMEAVAAHWSDVEILGQLNRTHRRAAMHLGQVPGNWLATSALLTPSASVITLPSNCSRPMYLEEVSSGSPIDFGEDVDNRRLSRYDSTKLSSAVFRRNAYLLGDTIEVNETGYESQVQLWYQKRVADLFFATADTGSGTYALVFPLASRPSLVDDYYNGEIFEALEGTGVGSIVTVSDYTGYNRTATVTVSSGTGVFDTTTVFGSRLSLPYEVYPWLVAETACGCMVKQSAAIDPAYFRYCKEQAKEAKEEWEEWISTRMFQNLHTRMSEEDL